MISDIFQVRANATREVVEIVRENLRRESTQQQGESKKMIDELEAEFNEDQVIASCTAVEPHSERQLKQLSENLSKRRDWLLDNQPIEIEAITMRPERRPKNKEETLKELLSEDYEYVDQYDNDDNEGRGHTAFP